MNTKKNWTWALQGILSNRCPICQNGQVFHWVAIMHEECPSCHYRFTRESGYFLGAMIIGYIFSAFSVVPTLVIGVMILREDLLSMLVVAGFQVVFLTPWVSRWSRLTWIYLDVRADPPQLR